MVVCWGCVATDRSLMWFCVWVFATTSYMWKYMYILYLYTLYAGVVCFITKYFCDFDVICWYEILHDSECSESKWNIEVTSYSLISLDQTFGQRMNFLGRSIPLLISGYKCVRFNGIIVLNSNVKMKSKYIFLKLIFYQV